MWLYRPADHKLSYRGTSRVIPLGAKSQSLLGEFPTYDPEAYVFSPAAAMAEVATTRSTARRTPKYPPHSKRNAAKRASTPKRAAAERYDGQGYGRAVAKAVGRINARRLRLAGDGNFGPLPHWHPNQRRHPFATEVRTTYRP